MARRIVDLGLLTIVLLLLAWAVIAGRTMLSEWRSWRPQPSRSVLPEAGPLAAARTVYFDAADARIAAWYLPPRNGAVIVIAHGAGGNRQQMTHEAEALARAGFGLLLPDMTGHGESTGDVNAIHHPVVVAGALDWLATEEPTARLGALGFSAGAMAVTLAAAKDPRIAAVISVSGKSDDWEFAKREHGRFGWLTWVPGVVAATLLGEAWSEMRPVDVIGKIAPRPLLLIHGAADSTVPVSMAHALYDHAGEPRTLWLVDGGSHGELWRVTAGSDYDARLVAFFSEALLRPSS